MHLESLTNLNHVWYDEKVGGNVLPFAEIEDHPDYNLDYRKDKKCFIVQDKKTGETYYFTRKSDGRLYIYTPAKNTMLLTTVEDQKKLYIKRQIKEADQAKDLLTKLWFPTVANFKWYIQNNWIKDNPVTLDYIAVMEDIYGTNIDDLKGKTVHRPTAHPKVTFTPVPEELINIHWDVVLSINIMYVNGLTFLTTILNHIKYRTVHYLPRQVADTLYNSLTFLTTILNHIKYQTVYYLPRQVADTLYKNLDYVFRIYNQGSYKITYAQVDPEFFSFVGTSSRQIRMQDRQTSSKICHIKNDKESSKHTSVAMQDKKMNTLIVHENAHDIDNIFSPDRSNDSLAFLPTTSEQVESNHVFP